MFVKIFSVIICTACFLYTSYVLCTLTYFLSNHNQPDDTSGSFVTDENVVLSTVWALLVDMALLSAFMLQHSIMATDFVKHLFCKLQMEYMSRSIYNLSSAAMLHLLLMYWLHTPWIFAWHLDTYSSNSLWLIFTAFHVLAWTIIYSGCLMLDISELAGLKQVYYKISSRPSPMEMKSRELIRYYSHMRHPSFTGFLIILWIHPFMTIDRVLLGSVLTVYMAMMWTIDENDYKYHASLVRRKHRELF